MNDNTKSKPPAKPKGSNLAVAATPGETGDKAVARTMLRPEVSAAITTLSFTNPIFRTVPINELVDQLSAHADAVNKGGMRQSERMLVSQAHTLDSIFNEMARLSALNLSSQNLTVAETCMRLALKAQGQCRATLESLSAIKNPPVVFAKQANFANGPQQVNNGIAPAGKNENEQSKLWEHGNGQRLDTRTTGAAIGADQAMEAVGAINGAEVH